MNTDTGLAVGALKCSSAVKVALSIALVMSFPLTAQHSSADEKPESKMKLLAKHRTLARFQGAPFHVCRGLTALCPEQCGDSGEFATFEVVTYLAYEKMGEYGDARQKTFRFQVSDFNRNPKGDKQLLTTVRDMEDGDLVLLEWHHLYGEVRPGMISPVRPVIELRKVTEQEAERLRDEAE